ncbi:MAG: hypothetical protein JWO87_3870 [Phycisphaerales bacterium]|nr:hypothetical protein [Phycisphaerales bacterium]
MGMDAYGWECNEWGGELSRIGRSGGLNRPALRLDAGKFADAFGF